MFLHCCSRYLASWAEVTGGIAGCFSVLEYGGFLLERVWHDAGKAMVARINDLPVSEM